MGKPWLVTIEPGAERSRSGWERQAEGWREPECRLRHACGTTLGAMSPDALEAMVRQHEKRCPA